LSTSEATTNGVQVEAAARFSAEHSAPHLAQWFFLYTIRITNLSDETVQLVARHWVITDATGKVEEVTGPGVVGEQPVLEPGESFEYTSGCPLKTPFGFMRGRYEMRATAGGRTFDAEIAPFELRQPHSLQ
jgi:ApaG protein